MTIKIERDVGNAMSVDTWLENKASSKGEFKINLRKARTDFLQTNRFVAGTSGLIVESVVNEQPSFYFAMSTLAR